METSGIYIFSWWQIALFFFIIGLLTGYHVGKLVRDIQIFYKVVKDYFSKDLAKKAKVLYLSNYKRKDK